MSLKKYQVFISSTFDDLKDERQKIVKQLLKEDCIPVGMECFNASSQSQFIIIKKFLDITDYLVLVIGQRYGSISQPTGLSYTEMEYDYAVDHDIPVLAFLYETNNHSDDKVKETNYEQLKKFKEKVKKNKEVNFWSDSADLIASICISVKEEIRNVQRPGWIRYEESDPDPQKQLEELQDKYYELSSKINKTHIKHKQSIPSVKNDPASILKYKCDLVLGSKSRDVYVEPKLNRQTILKLEFDIVIKDQETKSKQTIKVSVLHRNGWRYKVSHHYFGPKQAAPYFPGKEGCGSATITETYMDIANCLFSFYEVGSDEDNWILSKYYQL